MGKDREDIGTWKRKHKGSTLVDMKGEEKGLESNA